MLHRHRVWCVTPVASAEELAEKLTGTTWTPCTAFEIGGYLWLNDAASPDGGQEFAVVKRTGPTGRPLQVESITFSWWTHTVGRTRALSQVHSGQAGSAMYSWTQRFARHASTSSLAIRPARSARRRNSSSDSPARRSVCTAVGYQRQPPHAWPVCGLVR